MGCVTLGKPCPFLGLSFLICEVILDLEVSPP